MPACCKYEATHSAIPHSTPATIKVRFEYPEPSAPAGLSWPDFPRNAMTPVKNSAPMKLRDALKVNGPTLSEADVCATKAMPHSTAVINSSMGPFALK